MKGKTIIIIIITFTIVALAIGWFMTQHIILEYELERPTSIINGLH